MTNRAFEHRPAILVRRSYSRYLIAPPMQLSRNFVAITIDAQPATQLFPFEKRPIAVLVSGRATSQGRCWRRSWVVGRLRAAVAKQLLWHRAKVPQGSVRAGVLV